MKAYAIIQAVLWLICGQSEEVSSKSVIEIHEKGSKAALGPEPLFTNEFGNPLDRPILEFPIPFPPPPIIDPKPVTEVNPPMN